MDSNPTSCLWQPSPLPTYQASSTRLYLQNGVGGIVLQYCAPHHRIVIFTVYIIIWNTIFCMKYHFIVLLKRYGSASSKKEKRLYRRCQSYWQVTIIIHVCKKNLWKLFYFLQQKVFENYVAIYRKSRADELSLYHVWAWDLFIYPVESCCGQRLALYCLQNIYYPCPSAPSPLIRTPEPHFPLIGHSVVRRKPFPDTGCVAHSDILDIK
jgi:hypothetical protein